MARLHFAMMRWLFYFLSVTAGFAANGTTPGVFTTLATFECISVFARYDGDDNANNSAIVEWSPAGANQWKPVDTLIMWVDRRLQLATTFGTNSNTHSNQVRPCIVGLTPNTSYDVKITWSDSDGITGAASITNTLSTLSYAMVTNGTIRPVDPSLSPPWNELSNAVANAAAGETLVVSNGTYQFFTWANSGSGSAWIVAKAAPGHSPVIDGGTNQNNVRFSANNVVLDGFTLARATNTSLRIDAGQTNIWLLNNKITNAIGDMESTAAGAAGIRLHGQNTNIFILTNGIFSSRPTSTDTSIYGINLGPNLDTVVVADNAITNFWDSIGTGNNFNDGICRNGDIARNRLVNFKDDSVELEGDFNNVRFWSNTAHSTNAFSLLGLAGVIVGPCYLFRNVTYGANQNTSGIGVKNDHTRGSGRIVVVHNVFDTRPFTGTSSEVWSSGSNTVFRNNILSANGRCLRGVRSSCDLDYNCYTNTGDFASLWNGTTTYTTLADFQSGTGQESHGLFNAPQFNADYTLRSVSPAINLGVVISNFNDQASAWPLTDSAPDIGAFERPAPFSQTLSGPITISGGVTLR